MLEDKELSPGEMETISDVKLNRCASCRIYNWLDEVIRSCCLFAFLCSTQYETLEHLEVWGNTRKFVEKLWLGIKPMSSFNG